MNVFHTIPFDLDFLVAAQFLICGVICCVCICRLGQMHGNVLARVKVQYILLCVSSAALAFAPAFFHQWPSIVGLFFSAVVCYMLISDRYAWAHGVPAAAQTQPAELDRDAPTEKLPIEPDL